jgi:hypothetical protein
MLLGSTDNYDSNCRLSVGCHKFGVAQWLRLASIADTVRTAMQHSRDECTGVNSVCWCAARSMQCATMNSFNFTRAGFFHCTCNASAMQCYNMQSCSRKKHQ